MEYLGLTGVSHTSTGTEVNLTSLAGVKFAQSGVSRCVFEKVKLGVR